MFDLFRSRAKAVRYLLGAVLLLVALSMVVTLIPGFVGSSSAPDNVIAEIGDEVLTAREVQLGIQQQMRNNAFPREMAAVYVPIIVNQMISDRAVAYQAERMGFRVTDADVALSVESMLPQLFERGKFVGRDAYAQYLSQMNLTIPEFEENVRKQMLLLRLSNLALEGLVVSPKEVEEEFRRRNEKIKVDYVAVSAEDFRASVTVAPDEMKKSFEENKASFQTSEKREVEAVVVEQAAVTAGTSIPEEDLRRAYQSAQSDYRVPERVKVRHVLLKTTDKSDADKEKIRVKVEDLLKQIKGGADFAALAKANSEDTVSAANGGDLGWITRGQTVESFEKSAFSLKPGELSGVISTEYGFHIIQVQEKDQARLRTFEEVKTQLAEEMKKQRVNERMQQLADQAREELVKNPGGCDAIAAKLGLKCTRAAKFSAGDQIPDIGTTPDIDEAIGGLAKGGVTPVIQVGTNRLMTATVKEIYPARPSEFSEVEGQIRNALMARKAQEVAQERAKRVPELLKTAGGDLSRLAAALGVKVKSSSELGRDGMVDRVSAVYLKDVFAAGVGSVVGPINAGGTTVVCKVTGRTEADMSKLAAERDSIMTALKGVKARQRKELLEDGILTGLIKDGKVKIYERNVQRLTSAYQS